MLDILRIYRRTGNQSVMGGYWYKLTGDISIRVESGWIVAAINYGESAVDSRLWEASE